MAASAAHLVLSLCFASALAINIETVDIGAGGYAAKHDKAKLMRRDLSPLLDSMPVSDQKTTSKVKQDQALATKDVAAKPPAAGADPKAAQEPDATDASKGKQDQALATKDEKAVDASLRRPIHQTHAQPHTEEPPKPTKIAPHSPAPAPLKDTAAAADQKAAPSADATDSMPISDQETSAGRSFDSSCSIPEGMRAVKTSAGFMMVVLGDDDIVSKSFSKKGFWEIEKPNDMIPPEMKGKMTLPANGTLLDIGANIGDYTMLFASKGYNVIAVEPMTRNRAAMQATLCLNPDFKKRVKVVTAALVAPDEVANAKCVIEANKDNIGDGNLKCGKEADITKLNAIENVPVKTLDTALAELNVKAVDIVKMDVEGYECHVFAGGQSLFTKYRPQFLQIETLWGNATECVKHMSSKYSYSATLTGDNADTTMVAKQKHFFLRASESPPRSDMWTMTPA